MMIGFFRFSCVVLWACFVAFVSPVAAQTSVTLIATGSVWKYLADGTDQGTAWQGAGFNDASWPTGAAQLGFGDGDETTVINTPSPRPPTIYFRQTFVVRSSLTAVTLRLLRDDGAVVYLNGVEVRRDNMPAGTITFGTLAPLAVGGSDETTFFDSAIPTAALVAGTNVIAVEVHQNSVLSSDLSFALELVGTLKAPPGPVVTVETIRTNTWEIPPWSEQPIVPAVFRITRSGPTNNSLSVNLRFSGTASNGVDYEAVSGPVTVPIGATSAEVFISAKDDALVEGTESVILTLLPTPCPECYSVGEPSTATAYIIDNEPANTNVPPTLSIIEPTNGATFAGPTNIFIRTSANDSNGFLTIKTVEFFANGSSLGLVTNYPMLVPIAPFWFNWTNVAPGNYQLTAIASDDHGAKGTSTPVHISVTGVTTSSDRELHVIGIYSGAVAGGGSSHDHEQGQASITVNRPGKRITLCLSAYEPVLWHVTAGNATVIERIILCGYYAQTVDGVGPETEIIPANGSGNSPALFFGATVDCETFHRAAMTLHAMTGLEIASFQSAYTAPYPTPFVIDSVQNDPRLLSNYPQPTPASALPNLSFDLSFFDVGTSNFSTRHYTLAGPQDGDRLLPAIRVVPDDGGQYFYGQYWDNIFRVDSLPSAMQPLPFGAGLPQLSWASGVTFDSRRNRVLLSSFGGEGFLYAYSPTQNQWSVVSSLNNHDITGLHYHPANDSLYGVTLNFGECSATSIQRFTSAGGFVGQIPLPTMAGSFGPNSLRAEMISVGEYLVLLIEPSVFGGNISQESRIYLIDPRSNEVWLTYRRVAGPENKLPIVQVVWPGEGATLFAGGTNELVAQATDSDGLVASVEFFANGASIGFGHRSNNAASGVFSFNWIGAQPGAYTLIARATDGEGAVAVSSPTHIVITTNSPPDSGDLHELHAVGLQSGGAASIVVDRPGKSVTLFLSAYDSVFWHVSATSGTRIEKVIFGGYYAQRLDGIASNVPVVQVSYYRSGGYTADYLYTGPTMDSAMFLQTVQKLCALTGLGLSSFHGANNPPYSTPFVIDQVQNDVRLRCDYPQPADPSVLPHLNFQLAFLDRSRGGNVFFQNYTLAGPQNGTKLLPALRVVTDAGGRFYYGAEAHAMWRIDSQSGSVQEMDLGSSVPELSWPTGVAFDSARNRILLVTLSGEGYLYRYSPAQDQWSLVHSMENRDVNGLGYHAAADAIYAVKHTYQNYYGSPALYCYNSQGAFQREIPLPVLPFSLGPSDYETELVSVGDYLVLLIEPNYLSYYGSSATESRMYLIDPRTGQVTLTYRRINASDSDRDGVPDDRDLCPYTPYGVAVDAHGCSAEERDTDGDGVVDAYDQCPETPAGAIVNEHGCSIAQLCPCAGPWQNHRRYADCVSTNAEAFLVADLITEQESEDITSAAENSECGRRTPRLIAASQSTDEIRTNGCLVILEGDGPVTCVIDYSTDMIQWTPIRTNILDGTMIEIRDCDSIAVPQRFYRVRTPQAP